jgi:transcriptional regulator with XRE-family HTH domain
LPPLVNLRRIVLAVAKQGCWTEARVEADDYPAQRAWRAEEFVGQRIKARREELGWTQEEFGLKLKPLLGRAWSRSTVSVAESGGRAFTAGELLAIAHTLNVRVPRLLTPPIEVGMIEYPSGVELPSRMTTEMGVADAQLAAAWQDLAHAVSGTDRAREALKSLEQKLNVALLAAHAATVDTPDGKP